MDFIKEILFFKKEIRQMGKGKKGEREGYKSRNRLFFFIKQILN